MGESIRKKPDENLKPYNVKYIENPTQEKLRELALKHTPNIVVSAYGNLDRITRKKAREARYTYIVADSSEADKYSSKVIDEDKAQKIIDIQKRYIEDKGTLIQIDGYIGLDKKYAVPVQWLYTLKASNLAGMQQVLSFPREMMEDEHQLKEPHIPYMRVVMTPELFLDDMPGRMAVIVDLENWTTYVIGSDYFGESKKGMLRMLNEWVYQKGGLVLHAGGKIVKVKDEFVTMGIMGLSGTGKTTTTFSKQGEVTQPLQDDMLCFWPGGKFTITENGCFAKTFGLKKESEPIIYKGSTAKTAWIENGYINEDDTYDFSKTRLSREDVRRLKDILIGTGAPPENVEAYIGGKVNIDDVVNEYNIPDDGWDFLVWTQNGRSIIPMKDIEGAADPHNVPPVKFMGMLNRDEGSDAATPGIIKFASPEQSAGYFMLGETSKTSAAGKERGKTRSPFTQPFFPRAFGLQAIRFSELAAQVPDLVNWLMNTGYVGGDERDEQVGKALKVKIRHSSAMLEAMLRDEIKWKEDPDFGYFVVDINAPENAKLIGKVPVEILNPRVFYEKAGRLDEYKEWVSRMKKERKEFLEKYRVAPDVVKAVVRE